MEKRQVFNLEIISERSFSEKEVGDRISEAFPRDDKENVMILVRKENGQARGDTIENILNNLDFSKLTKLGEGTLINIEAIKDNIKKVRNSIEKEKEKHEALRLLDDISESLEIIKTRGDAVS